MIFPLKSLSDDELQLMYVFSLFRHYRSYRHRHGFLISLFPWPLQAVG